MFLIARSLLELFTEKSGLRCLMDFQQAMLLLVSQQSDKSRLMYEWSAAGSKAAVYVCAGERRL